VLMGDSRRHRGPHPLDDQLFAASEVDKLRAAVEDMSWLRTRGYAERSALKLVGDRYQLRQRQRVAVARSACSDQQKEGRAARRLAAADVAGKPLAIDGLNVITTVEVALAGGALFVGRDQCLRDMASFHGNYRLVQETERAVAVLIEVVDALQPSEARVYIDLPVSNSGRLAQTVRFISESHGVALDAMAAPRVDETLMSLDAVVATADSAILDRCGEWVNLARLAVQHARSEVEPLWLLDFS
jgi:hypothetical protein